MSNTRKQPEQQILELQLKLYTKMRDITSDLNNDSIGYMDPHNLILLEDGVRELEYLVGSNNAEYQKIFKLKQSLEQEINKTKDSAISKNRRKLIM